MAFYRYLKTEPTTASSWLFYCLQLQIEILQIVCLAQKWCNISTWTLRLCFVHANLFGWHEIFRTLHDLYRPFSCQSVLMKHESMFAFFVISRYWNFGIASLGDDVRFSKLKFRNHFCAMILTTDCDIFTESVHLRYSWSVFQKAITSAVSAVDVMASPISRSAGWSTTTGVWIYIYIYIYIFPWLIY